METLNRVYDLIKNGYKPCTDSRLANEKSIFFALKGENFDGNLFAKEVLEKGAKLAVCDNPSIGNLPGLIHVPNTLNFLQNLARHHRKQLTIPVIGLTGSNGKTTTKELLQAVLSKNYNAFATQGNLNNHIGVPLSILSVNEQHQIAIIEMGANHIGEIEALCSIAQPTHGIITNIGKAHLEGFGSFEGVKKAKTELYAFLAKTNGTVFVNSKNQILLERINHFDLYNIIEYNNYLLNAEVDKPENNLLSLSISINNTKLRVSTQMAGEYNMENILAAICIGQFFNVTIENCLDAISEYTPSNNRSQIVNTAKNIIVLDAYNANPTSMEAALTNFYSTPSKKPKALILGEMLELGEYSHEEHKKIFTQASTLFSSIYTVGEEYRDTSKSINWFRDVHSLKMYLREYPLENHFILVKGSRGVKLEEVLEEL
ncbi:MAG TPA: UDP-N-acetylmuramoyl-tripeptide--D-alanyl-D-alanine ligase [Bacteroidetes bacterium]|nr:UDP-N-acetylmuramoyl-tripeptide--D-alanyl-D-alanine ligase [Bacteroidota bacterium]